MRFTKFAVVGLGVLASGAMVSAQTVYLYNTSFSQCAQPCPADYGSPTEWAPEGGNFPTTVGVWRDVVDFNSAPAALSILSINADSSGNYNQAFKNTDRKPAAAGASYTWEAYVKVDSSSGGSMQLVVHFSCGTYWTECGAGGWTTLHYASAPTAGWVRVSGTATVPAAATWGLMRIFASGIIAAHVDDIKINGQNEVVPVVYDRAAAQTTFNIPSVSGAVISLPRATAYKTDVVASDGRLVTSFEGTGSAIDLSRSNVAKGLYQVKVSAVGMSPFTSSMVLGK